MVIKEGRRLQLPFNQLIPLSKSYIRFQYVKFIQNIPSYCALVSQFSINIDSGSICVSQVTKDSRIEGQIVPRRPFFWLWEGRLRGEPKERLRGRLGK